DNRQSGKARVGYEKRLFNTSCFEHFRQFFDAAGAKKHSGWKIPFCGQCGHIASFQFRSDLFTQVKGFWPGKISITNGGKSGTFARVLNAGPYQCRIEIIAAVHEYSPGFELLT